MTWLDLLDRKDALAAVLLAANVVQWTTAVRANRERLREKAHVTAALRDATRVQERLLDVLARIATGG